ncbi:sensor histidine kinase [Nonomuraea sp. NPDC050790]|uniref:sensor histidine kinase n=1 Tax=Nonomuraea sp. NPDC050790 TaxID=3364371 RepID=UPI0037B158F7
MDRWLRAFHLLFYAFLATSSALAVLVGAGARPVTLMPALVMGVYYWLLVLCRSGDLERLHPMGWHFLVLLGLYFLLVRGEPVYELLQFGMYPLAWVMLPRKWGYAGAFGLILTSFLASGQFARLPTDPRVLTTFLASTLLLLIMGWFVNHLVQKGEMSVLQERARLAREIHDTLAQGLSGIVVQLEAAEQAVDDPAATRHRITVAKRLAREHLDEARRSVEALRPEPLCRATIDAALPDVAARWAVTSGVPTPVTVHGHPRPLEAEREATLLRVAQEALANIAKHARARQVSITLSYTDDEVILDVVDDGDGFDTTAAPGRGYGLTCMRERAASVGGALTVESARAQGTVVSASIPYMVPGKPGSTRWKEL